MAKRRDFNRPYYRDTEHLHELASQKYDKKRKSSGPTLYCPLCPYRTRDEVLYKKHYKEKHT